MLLLFASATGYQIRVFADAARRLGIELALASDRCHVLDDPWGDRAIPVRFDREAESLGAPKNWDLLANQLVSVHEQAVGGKPTGENSAPSA